MNNTVYLLVGQRGSGKSHLADQILKKQPAVSLISRDMILVELFGSTSLSPYSNAHGEALYIMFEQLQKVLQDKTSTIILDCWTGHSQERQRLIEKLKSFGVTRIIALYFKTPLELVNEWFWLKPNIAKITEMKEKQDQGFSFFSVQAPARDYELFHMYAENISHDGFDEVIIIEDPRNTSITLE